MVAVQNLRIRRGLGVGAATTSGKRHQARMPFFSNRKKGSGANNFHGRQGGTDQKDQKEAEEALMRLVGTSSSFIPSERIDRGRCRRRHAPIEIDYRSQAGEESSLSTDETSKQSLRQRLICCKQQTDPFLDDFPLDPKPTKVHPTNVNVNPLLYHRVGGNMGKPLNVMQSLSSIDDKHLPGGGDGDNRFDTTSVVVEHVEKAFIRRRSLAKISSSHANIFGPLVSQDFCYPVVDAFAPSTSSCSSSSSSSSSSGETSKALPSAYNSNDKGSEQLHEAPRFFDNSEEESSMSSNDFDNDDDWPTDLMLCQAESELSSNDDSDDDDVQSPNASVVPPSSKDTIEVDCNTKSSDNAVSDNADVAYVDASQVDDNGETQSRPRQVFRPSWDPPKTKQEQPQNYHLYRNRGGLPEVASLDTMGTTATYSSATMDLRITVLESLFDELSSPSNDRSERAAKAAICGPISAVDRGDKVPKKEAPPADDNSLFECLPLDGVLVERLESTHWLAPGMYIEIPAETAWMVETAPANTDDAWSGDEHEEKLLVAKQPVVQAKTVRFDLGKEKEGKHLSQEPQRGVACWSNLGDKCEGTWLVEQPEQEKLFWCGPGEAGEESSTVKQSQHGVSYWCSPDGEELDENSIVLQPEGRAHVWSKYGEKHSLVKRAEPIEAFGVSWKAAWSLSSGGSYDTSLMDDGCQWSENFNAKLNVADNDIEKPSQQGESRSIQVHNLSTATGWLGTENMVQGMFNCGKA